MKDEPGQILTLDEVAAYLKVGKRTVYRLAAAKEIPAFKVGGIWRFRKADLERWIASRTGKAAFDGERGGESDQHYFRPFKAGATRKKKT